MAPATRDLKTHVSASTGSLVAFASALSQAQKRPAVRVGPTMAPATQDLKTHVSASTESFVAFASVPSQAQNGKPMNLNGARHGASHRHSPTHRRGTGPQQWLSGVQGHSDKHALGHYPKAQCAFKILMIHEVLQFALRIAFRCVLHRCGSQDIHR